MKLTPQELLFQSFKHSQGSVTPQLGIFRYMKLAHDIEVDLHPTGQDQARFANYLTGTHRNSRAHIQTTPETENHDGVVISSMKTIREYHNHKKYGQKIQRADLPTVVGIFAREILYKECTLLNVDDPWTNYRTKQEADRPTRKRARIESGKSSFLYLHGRDQVTTGRPEFDDLYQSAWEYLEERPALKPELSDHARIVVDAELSTMGRLVLGRIEDIS